MYEVANKHSEIIAENSIQPDDTFLVDEFQLVEGVLFGHVADMNGWVIVYHILTESPACLRKLNFMIIFFVSNFWKSFG